MQTQTITLKIKISLAGDDLSVLPYFVHVWKINITNIDYPDIHSAIWSLEFCGLLSQCEVVERHLASRVWIKSGEE